ncbi:helix-turn-helix domain-containing protein [Streptomyces sp. NPDC093085]|uniref:TetR/AcrR family transcriptional regulator n=1 Tax=Streptomyces sp. NPDC093085 TaxID=3155068 RepID=UPI00341FAEE5
MTRAAGRAPGRRRVDARSNVERITAAGRVVLGTEEGSLERIAAEAGVGIATLYRHFPNREAIVRAVLDDILDSDVLPLIDDAEASATPRAALLEIAGRLLDLISEERGLVGFASDFATVAEAAIRRLSAAVHPLLVRAQEQDEVRADLTAEDIPRFLVMAVAGLGLPGTTPELRARFLTLIFDALSPTGATPLPPLAPEGDSLHTAISGIGRR